MRRRDFISVLGSLAAWPFAARAQQLAMPTIGYLVTTSAGALRDADAAFHRGLKETGFIEGQNVAVEYRWAEGQYDRLPALAAELVQRQVAVIVAFAPPAALAAKAATSTIPIVFNTGTDPLKLGLVSSLNRPSGNITGVTFISTGLEPKWLELLHEMVPSATTIGVLVNPNFPEVETQLKDISTGAHAIGLQTLIVKASTPSGITEAFSTLIEQRIGALVVSSDPFFFSQRDQLVALAAHHRIPAIYQLRAFAVIGGLMSYGTSLESSYRQTGLYTGYVLKGTKPADLPVYQSTKFELVVNLRTAKALGLEVPLSLLMSIDEVIE
jgi:putative tryptophan/tyrosine transport system substrate-binding protein